MTGDSYESSAESFHGAALPRDDRDVAAPAHDGHTPRFTRAYAEVVRDLLAGRYVIGDAIDWESSARRRGQEPPIVGAGGPGLLLEGVEAEGGAPVSILILDPLLWPDDESFHTARIAANRLSTARDPTLILPRRVLWEVSARCIVLVLEPVPAPPHRGPAEASLDEQFLRSAGIALCKAARTLTRLGQGGITCEEVWFGSDGQVRVLRVPGIRRDPDHGAAQGVASVVQRMLDGAGITPDARLSRALRRARATPRYEDADALEVLQRALSSRRAVRAGATAAFLCAAAGIVWLGTALTWVDANESVVLVNAWGGRRTVERGLHLKWPSPIETAQLGKPVETAATETTDSHLAEPAGLTTSPPSMLAAAPPPEPPPEPEPIEHASLSAQEPDISPPPAQPGPALLTADTPPLEPAADPEPQENPEPAPPPVASAEPDSTPDTAPQPQAVALGEPGPDPAAEAAEAAPAPAPEEPFPARPLVLYFARGTVDQARTAVNDLAARFDDLADRRSDAVQRGDEETRASAAQAMRILADRGVDAAWLGSARARLHDADAALAQEDAPLALTALGGLADEAIARLQGIAGAEAAAAALRHAEKLEQAWRAAPQAAEPDQNNRAEQALADIDAGRDAIAAGDLTVATERLTAGAAALEEIAVQTALAKARQSGNQAAALLGQWDTAWAGLAAAGFPAPGEIAAARRHYEAGLEQLAAKHADDAAEAFRFAADLAQRRLDGLAEDRHAASQIDHRGRTPLHLAALSGDVQRARYALALGAPVHARDIEGNSPIRLAITAGNLAVARVLLESGADVNDRAGSGRPLVFDAVKNPPAFLLLLEHGARAGWTVRGSTLLHEIAWARARHGVGDADQVRMAAALLDRGVDPAAPDASGETPLQVAERTRAEALADFLRKRANFGRDLEQPGSRAPARAN